MSSVLVGITIGLPWLGAVAVWLVGDERPRIQQNLASAVSVAAALVSLTLPLHASDAIELRIPMGGAFGDFTLLPDGLGVYLTVVASVVGCLTVIYSRDYMHAEGQLSRYYALVLLFIGAMDGLVLSGSLLLTFLFWEVTAFCSYALISFHNDDPKAVAGGVKALIVTQLGGIGLLAGALLAYAHFGDYQIRTFLAQADSLPPQVLKWVAFGFLAAAAAKSAQVPFHTWLPDAMEAPTPVTALIHAATMVNAGVYLLARFYPAFVAVPGWTLAVLSVGLLSALSAAVMALAADDLKRALAYSTVSQLGYMVYAVGTGGIVASQFHLLSHALFKALLFLGAGAVIHVVGTRDMRQMGGLGKRMPLVGATFTVGCLGLIGLPPSNGFISKELVLESGLTRGPWWAYAGMLVGAGITALYSARMISMVFGGEPHLPARRQDAPPAMRFSLLALSLGTLSSWLLAGPFSDLLGETLPFHGLAAKGTTEVVVEVITAPATWAALILILLGLALGSSRGSLAGVAKALRPVADLACKDMGFEWLNRGVIRLILTTASGARTTQTGVLSWNVLGVVLGLIALLAMLTRWG